MIFFRVEQEFLLHNFLLCPWYDVTTNFSLQWCKIPLNGAKLFKHSQISAGINFATYLCHFFSLCVDNFILRLKKYFLTTCNCSRSPELLFVVYVHNPFVVWPYLTRILKLLIMLANITNDLCTQNSLKRFHSLKIVPTVHSTMLKPTKVHIQHFR